MSHPRSWRVEAFGAPLADVNAALGDLEAGRVSVRVALEA